MKYLLGLRSRKSRHIHDVYPCDTEEERDELLAELRANLPEELEDIAEFGTLDLTDKQFNALDEKAENLKRIPPDPEAHSKETGEWVSWAAFLGVTHCPNCGEKTSKRGWANDDMVKATKLDVPACKTCLALERDK